MNQTVKRLLVEAIVSFIFWTGALTPYMLFVTCMTLEQYTTWLIMQAVLMPPLSILSLIVLRWAKRRLKVA